MRNPENIIDDIGKFQNFEIILNYGKSLERINPLDFKDIYSIEEINEDLEYLNLVEKRIGEDFDKKSVQEKEISLINEKRATCFEIILDSQINEADWLGSEAMTSRSSRYDDIMGVDLIVEFNKEETKRVALAVDASTSSDIHVMNYKISRNLKKIAEKENLQEVKYFESQIRDNNGEYYKGKIDNLLPIVIGADKQNADNLFDLFSELKSLEKRKDDDSKKRRQWLRVKLSKDPIQEIFLKEIKIQLEMYKSIIDREDVKIEADNILRIIQEIIQEKNDFNLYSESDVPRDETLDNIELICKEYVFKKEGE